MTLPGSGNPPRGRVRPGRGLITVAATLLLAACAAPERVVLLPQADGSPSAVVVTSRGGQAVLDKPYTVASVGQREVRVEATDAASVAARYRPVMEALPAHPRSYTLQFEFGRTRLTRESRELLDRLLDEMQQLPAPELVIIGHADEVGSDAVNDRLSRERADAVLTLIRTKGIALRHVEVVARGKRDPLVPRKGGIPEQRNRRVEIRIK